MLERLGAALFAGALKRRTDFVAVVVSLAEEALKEGAKAEAALRATAGATMPNIIFGNFRHRMLDIEEALQPIR